MAITVTQGRGRWHSRFENVPSPPETAVVQNQQTISAPSFESRKSRVCRFLRGSQCGIT